MQRNKTAIVYETRKEKKGKEKKTRIQMRPPKLFHDLVSQALDKKVNNNKKSAKEKKKKKEEAKKRKNRGIGKC